MKFAIAALLGANAFAWGNRGLGDLGDLDNISGNSYSFDKAPGIAGTFGGHELHDIGFDKRDS